MSGKKNSRDKTNKQNPFIFHINLQERRHENVRHFKRYVVKSRLAYVLATTKAITVKQHIRTPNTPDTMYIKAIVPCPQSPRMSCSRILT